MRIIFICIVLLAPIQAHGLELLRCFTLSASRVTESGRISTLNDFSDISSGVEYGVGRLTARDFKINMIDNTLDFIYGGTYEVLSQEKHNQWSRWILGLDLAIIRPEVPPNGLMTIEEMPVRIFGSPRFTFSIAISDIFYTGVCEPATS